jgi:hypothetical protein
MTDDITRGLALLADEVEPAPVDSRDVITRARTRTRDRRATVATAFATIALIGTLAATAGIPGSPPAAPESREDRLTRVLTGAMADLIPSGWTLETRVPSESTPLTFRCDVSGTARVWAASDGQPPTPISKTAPDGCSAYADYDDGVGRVEINLVVHKFDLDFADACWEAPCTTRKGYVREVLSDGTQVKVTTLTGDSLSEAGTRDLQDVFAERPDGTQVSMSVSWPHGQRSNPPFTAEQLVRFASRFTY